MDFISAKSRLSRLLFFSFQWTFYQLHVLWFLLFTVRGNARSLFSEYPPLHDPLCSGDLLEPVLFNYTHLSILIKSEFLPGSSMFCCLPTYASYPSTHPYPPSPYRCTTVGYSYLRYNPIGAVGKFVMCNIAEDSRFYSRTKRQHPKTQLYCVLNTTL